MRAISLFEGLMLAHSINGKPPLICGQAIVDAISEWLIKKEEEDDIRNPGTTHHIVDMYGD